MTAETEYLTAKRTVDDRALNQRVLSEFSEAIATQNVPVSICEVGAGTGTMVARLARLELLPDRCFYRLVERNPECVSVARTHLPEWLSEAGYTCAVETKPGSETKSRRADNSARGEDSIVERISATDGKRELTVEIRQQDIREISLHHQFDAVVACAVLDIVPREILSKLMGLLAPGGVCYTPITFDGLTGFVPSHPLDSAVTEAYHGHMADRKGLGPNAGRAVLDLLSNQDTEILAVGGSDWVIRPVSGQYPNDEQFVAEYLLATVVAAVSERIDQANTQLTRSELARWETDRNNALAQGELTVIAHNLDILARQSAQK